MKKYQFSKHLLIVIIVIGILLIADYILGSSFFSVLSIMFFFFCGVSLGINVELE